MQRIAMILVAALAAMQASAIPQAVTSAISPTAAAPAGCSASYSGTFGIAVVSLTSAASSTATAASADEDSATVVSQISDGQIQAATTAVPIQQISDGQIQHQTTTEAIQQISDGQIQHQTSPTSQQQTTATTEAVQQISDGQIQDQTTSTAETMTTSTTQAVSQISDGQIQATATAAVKARDTVGCKSNSTLTMTLSDGKLVDSIGRTGYIASNYQFQFDKPAQAGAIYTAGWSACSNGSLALGGSAVFWQCKSGDFYNLYDRSFGAAQCSPVLLEAIGLEDCS